MRLTAALCIFLTGSALAQPPKRPEAPRFSAVVAERFDAWDKDHNAVLSPEEIDRLVVNPSIRGKDAAALAAMKLVVRSNKIKPPELTRDFLEHHAEDPAGEPIETPADAKAAARPPASLQKRFESAYRRINGAKRELFADETPDIDHCHQGPLGDCFVVAGIGALAHRDSASIRKMITPRDDGSFKVEFPDGRGVTIEPLTDAEYALTSTTGDEGYWLSVLEKAYGALRNGARPSSKQTEETTDAIARGGSLATTLQALTGHAIDKTTLRSRAVKDDAAAASIAATVRSKLLAAMKDHRLAGCGTGKDPCPPGINLTHAYAILGYNPDTDAILLWNPHGNTFRPRGDAGLKNGYPTRAGQFEIPVTDFVRVFNGMSVETERPASSSRRSS
jgi:hypothetical protein